MTPPSAISLFSLYDVTLLNEIVCLLSTLVLEHAYKCTESILALNKVINPYLFNKKCVCLICFSFYKLTFSKVYDK